MPADAELKFDLCIVDASSQMRSYHREHRVGGHQGDPPVQGIVATKLTVHPKGGIPNNSPPGTIVASVTVTMSPPHTPFSRALVLERSDVHFPGYGCGSCAGDHEGR